MKKKIAILGSTGSIGTQALDVISKHKSLFEVEVLTANNNADLLIKQAEQHNPNFVVICNEKKYPEVFAALDKKGIKVFCGKKSIEDIVESESIDIVLTALVGYSGLMPTIKAIKNGKRIALANKETLVVAGSIINKLCKEKKVNIYPVDSEHSAIFQCLVGESRDTIDKIILTASGGPFRNKKLNELKNISKKEALNHPNWEMGEKITIDSSTLMNKGLEVIEAKFLFDIDIQKIKVVVHPQSIIHSMVEFNDGSIKAQLGEPDMKLPIQYALFSGKRLKNKFTHYDFIKNNTLTFEEPCLKTFNNLKLAFDAGKLGGNAPCILNASNEIVVDAFLNEKIRYLDMTKIIEDSLNKISYIASPNLDQLIETDIVTRKYTLDKINKL